MTSSLCDVTQDCPRAKEIVRVHIHLSMPGSHHTGERSYGGHSSQTPSLTLSSLLPSWCVSERVLFECLSTPGINSFVHYFLLRPSGRLAIERLEDKEKGEEEGEEEEEKHKKCLPLNTHCPPCIEIR